MANKAEGNFTAVGRKNNSRLAKMMIGAGSAGKTAFFAALVQIVENAFDAGADFVNIIVEKGKTLMFIDNGHGFRKPDVTGFYDMLYSGKEGRQDLIGQNGSGRYFLLQICGEVVVISVSEDFPKGATFSLNKGDMEELLSKNTIERTTKSLDLPPWWNLLGNGSAICLKDVHWGPSIPSEAKIVSEASSYLLPSLARMVTVNGVPLKPRNIEGEVVYEKIKVDYLTGVQEIELYIPQVRNKLDTIRLGALNYICSLSGMASQLSSELSNLVPNELLAGTVCGDIMIPALKEYRDHNGNKLTESFFEKDIHLSVIRFLVDEVAPRIRSAFERKKQAEDKERHAKLFSDICDSVNDAFNLESVDIDPLVVKGEGGTKERPPVNVTPAQVVLMPGQSQTFQVRRTHGEFQWDASKSGGTLSAKSGRQVVYTAGKKVGRFDLVIRDRNDPEKARSVRIQIVEEKRLVITPIRIDIVAGEEQEFKLLNHDVTSGDIKWELAGSVKGLKLSKEDGLRVLVQTTKGTPCGDYTLRAFDRKDPTQSVEATFNVVEPENESNILKFEDHPYVLGEANAHIQCIVRRDKASGVNLSGKGEMIIDVLRVDTSHEFLVNVRRVTNSNEALVQALLPHLVYAHLKGRIEDGEEGDMVSLHDRQAQILRQVMIARVAKSKGGKKDGE